MIRGLHGLLYSSAPEEARTFLRDALRLPHTDVGGGWLIFDLPEADLGVHPVDPDGGAKPGAHDVSFYCDDIHGTVAELKSRGVVFRGEPADHGYGWVTYFEIPGGITVQLYEPKYGKAAAAESTAAKVAKRVAAPVKKAVAAAKKAVSAAKQMAATQGARKAPAKGAPKTAAKGAKKAPPAGQKGQKAQKAQKAAPKKGAKRR